MASQGFDVTMISADGPEVNALKEQEGCEHMVVPFTRTISPFQDLRCLFQLIRIFRRLKPDIVHTHTPKAGLLGMLAARITGVPVRLHTIAGLPWMETKGPVRRLLVLMEKITAFAANRIYPNSKVLYEYLLRQGIAAGKMKVLGQGSSNGINCRHFTKDDIISGQADKLLQQEGLDAHSLIWIFVGRIVRDKGIAEMIDAFSVIRQQYPGDRLWLLGEEEPELDPLDEKYQRLLREDPSIRCWGFQKDIRPYLAAASVLVFPSYREGFPNVPMQAGAMGCTLILSDINGCNEIVDHGINGLLVPVKDTAALTAAMQQVRSDQARRESMANLIREKIRLTFDQETLWKLILGEYRSWLDKKK